MQTLAIYAVGVSLALAVAYPVAVEVSARMLEAAALISGQFPH